MRHLRIARDLPFAVRVAEQAHLFAVADLRRPDLEGAIDQVIGISIEAMRGEPCSSEAQGSSSHPGRLVGEADEPDLALGHEPAERGKDLVDGVAVAFEMPIVEALGGARRPVGPVELVEVDIILS